MMTGIVCEKLGKLQRILPDPSALSYIRKIGNVLFMHGGLCRTFVRRTVPKEFWDDPEKTIEYINGLGPREMWQDDSPIWYRPQYEDDALYGEGELLQVVGHTPVRDLYRKGSVISTDVFSTYASGTPIGPECFAIVDTDTGRATRAGE